ncbi:SET domain-containing protein [Morchella conica CCBAS932]|uniref:SET domain-containing protein n=1 Tax=Morchella conica CCBAS932 TaxID=1392247 RepID=A0A3N4L714_9PEZI|nr:SET domain-containing protein [Morchella conica CCBAS932]
MSIAREFSTDPAFQKFGEWIIANGGFIQESLVFTSPESRVGSQMLTTAALPPSSKLLTCPHTLAIDYQKVKAHYPPEFIEAVSPHAALCTFVVGEWLKGDASFWAPYLRILPREFDTPLYFDDEDMKWLVGCNLNAEEVKTRKKVWMEEWEAASEALRRQRSVGSRGAREYTWELFLWAATAFSSRSFPGKLLNWTTESSMTEIDDPDCLPALFPLIDSVNHQPLTKITWAPGDNALNVVSGDEIPAGGEVCNNYGPKSNEELLMGYGFTLPGNPFDTVVLRFLPVLSPAQESIRALQPASPFPDGIHHLSPRNPNSLYPASLINLFHLLTATPEELPLLEANPAAETITLRNTIATHRQLLLAIRRKLDGFPAESTLPPLSNSRRRSAKVYRDTQVSIMTAAVAESEGVIRNILETKREVVVTLESILEDPVYSAAVEPCFGSVLPLELQMAGHEDLVFTLYLCWRYLQRDQLPEAWKKWFGRLLEAGECGNPEDLEEVEELYKALFPAVAGAAPEVFDGEGWTEGLLRWGMRAFGRESIGVRLEGKEAEVVIVCIE